MKPAEALARDTQNANERREIVTSTIIHAGARKEGGKKKETLRASLVSRFQSCVWSFSSLARSRSTDHEKRETAGSVQQKQQFMCFSLWTTISSHPPLSLFDGFAGFLSFL